jgi:predicted transcriptional regulator
MCMPIGQKIQRRLKEQGQSVTWFAKQLNCNRTNIYNIFKKVNVDTELLKRICKILNYNFFQDMADDIKLSEK